MKYFNLNRLFVFRLLAMVFLTGIGLSVISCKDKQVEAPVAKKPEVVLAKPVDAVVWKIQPKKSKLLWLGKKVTGQHNGTVNVSGGELYFTKSGLAAGNLTADMTSIENEDVKNETFRTKLVNHLKNPDFFDVEQFPESKIEITGVSQSGQDSAVVQANLTIRGITNPIETTVTLAEVNGEKTITGQIVVDRTLWGIQYKSGKFFPELGDKMIYDEMELSCYLVLKK